MNKYNYVETSILKLFGEIDWTTNNIKTLPSNFQDDSKEFIRLNFFYRGAQGNIDSGKLLIDIYVESQVGTRRVTEISDKLDKLLVKKNFQLDANSIQIGESNLQYLGYNQNNTTQYVALYSVDFKLFRSI